MTNKDAAFLLGAWRPNGADAGDPEFAAAMEQVRNDPALDRWFSNQSRQDAAIAAGFQSLLPPTDLRSRILTGGRVSRRERWFFQRWTGRLALAAVIVIFAGVITWRQVGSWRTGSRVARVQFTEMGIKAISGLVSGRENFDVTSPKAAILEDWLRKNRWPVTGTLPPGLDRLASAGCKKVSWNGRPVSIICFHGPGGQLVHLVMTSRTGVEDAPPEGKPLFTSRDGWQMAVWSQGEMAMMLVTRAPEAELRPLFAAILSRPERGSDALFGFVSPVAAVELNEEGNRSDCTPIRGRSLLGWSRQLILYG